MNPFLVDGFSCSYHHGKKFKNRSRGKQQLVPLVDCQKEQALKKLLHGVKNGITVTGCFTDLLKETVTDRNGEEEAEMIHFIDRISATCQRLNEDMDEIVKILDGEMNGEE